MALLRRPSDDRPLVWLLGDARHAEFAEAVDLLHATARVGHVASIRRVSTRHDLEAQSPELIVLTSCRPGMLRAADIERLRRHAPLAGIVSLLGTWCEGEMRTGRPPAGVLRSYWYEFPNWWQRQLALRAVGRCPEWARPSGEGVGSWESGVGSRRDPGHSTRANGLIALDTTCWDTADALADVLRRAGFATAWSSAGAAGSALRGVVAGVWEGKQLDADESDRLGAFCRRLAIDHAPVIVVLDFPRRDRCEVAHAAGAATVLGKPWANADLLTAIGRAIERRRDLPRAA